uniref:Dynein light chain n=1 Tax=Parascaris equorum TaxID=6256 RepID=A0A914R9K8_PAREQ
MFYKRFDSYYKINDEYSVEMLHSRAQIAETIAKNQILSGNNNEQMIACAIKRRFDDLYGSSWQCIVGKSFGCYITHLENHFLFFYFGGFAVLLYKNN